MIFQLVDSEDKVVDTIAAHKVILAVHNEYFRAIKYINNFPITMDNVAMDANTALDLFNIFDEVSENILKSCADLLTKQDSSNLCYFCKDPCSSLQDMKQHIMTVHNVKLSVAQLKKILKEKKY